MNGKKSICVSRSVSFWMWWDCFVKFNVLILTIFYRFINGGQDETSH